MRLSSLLSTARLSALGVCTLLAAACATPIDGTPQGSELDGDTGGSAGSAGTGSSVAGMQSNASGASSGGAPGVSAGSTGFGGSAMQAGSGGTLGSAGMTGSAGASKGGTTSSGGSNTGGAGKGGTSSGGATGSAGAGKGGATGSAGSTAAAGATGSAGSTSSTPCDAAHSKATLTHNTLYTGKANDCVRLSVNPDWAQVTVSFTPQPGTVYPVPFTYTSACAASGNLTLAANYADAIIKSGANPGCDYYVQFKGGSTTVKVYYYD